MIRFRPIALAALAAATLGLSACGDDGQSGADAAAKASKQLQERGIPKDQADDLAATAQRLKDRGISDADAARLKRKISDGQRRATALQQQLVDVTKKVQSKALTETEGTKRLADLRRRIQEQALATAATLEKAGALPEGAKKQIETARKQLEDGVQPSSTAPTVPGQ